MEDSIQQRPQRKPQTIQRPQGSEDRVENVPGLTQDDLHRRKGIALLLLVRLERGDLVDDYPWTRSVNVTTVLDPNEQIKMSVEKGEVPRMIALITELNYEF